MISDAVAHRSGYSLGRTRCKGYVNERLSHARFATLVCGRAVSCTAESSITYRLGTGATRRHPMAHLVDKEFVERANMTLLLGILWGGFAACVVGALAYDIAYWLQGW